MADEVSRALQRLRKGTVARKLESQTLDFKAPSPSQRATFTNVAEAATCFANATGGTVVLGIADDVVWPNALIGTDLSAETLRRAIYERTAPALDVAVEPVAFEGVTLLLVGVGEGLEV